MPRCPSIWRALRHRSISSRRRAGRRGRAQAWNASADGDSLKRVPPAPHYSRSPSRPRRHRPMSTRATGKRVIHGTKESNAESLVPRRPTEDAKWGRSSEHPSLTDRVPSPSLRRPCPFDQKGPASRVLRGSFRAAPSGPLSALFEAPGLLAVDRLVAPSAAQASRTERRDRRRSRLASWARWSSLRSPIGESRAGAKSRDRSPERPPYGSRRKPCGTRPFSSSSILSSSADTSAVGLPSAFATSRRRLRTWRMRRTSCSSSILSRALPADSVRERPREGC
jgi:hypothetical protein